MVKKDSPLPVNLGLPLLLFDSRTIRKLLARNVVFDTTSGRITENDDTVVIPKDYEGKVSLSTRIRVKLKSRGRKFDPPVRQHSLCKYAFSSYV